VCAGDERTASDSREFLLRWFDRFPQYRDHDFWLSGESYAGHYVPQLADAVLRGNREDAEERAINLRGFLVGNALTDPALDSPGALDFWWSHALVSTQARDGIRANCNFSRIDPLASQVLPAQ
jgi:serine carboxypeptidase-like clade 2